MKRSVALGPKRSLKPLSSLAAYSLPQSLCELSSLYKVKPCLSSTSRTYLFGDMPNYKCIGFPVDLRKEGHQGPGTLLP